jgi:long-subunit acyl-CoA synthetase (AMP-forming)
MEVRPLRPRLHTTSFGLRKTGSIGILYRYRRRSLTSKTDQEISQGDCGELILKGPQVMKGY